MMSVCGQHTSILFLLWFLCKAAYVYTIVNQQHQSGLSIFVYRQIRVQNENDRRYKATKASRSAKVIHYLQSKASQQPDYRMILEDTVKFRKCAKTPEDVAKWRLTYNFIIETKFFLERYDSIVETWDLCDKQFLLYLFNIEELLTSLLYKYTTVSTDYIKHPRLPKVEIKCCDHLFESSKDLHKHYYTVHHTPGRVNDVRFCEMKAGLVKLVFYKNSLKYYLEFGTWCDHVLCLYLKKIYRKLNVTLDPFRDSPLAPLPVPVKPQAKKLAPKPETESEPESEPESELDSDSELESKSELQSEPQPEPQSEPQSEPQPEPQPVPVESAT